MHKPYKKVYIEITNRCNLSCSFCPGTARPARTMSPEEFTRVLEQVAPYTSYLYLHLMGEPLLHPELDRLLELSGRFGLRVNLTTNGLLLGAMQKRLIAASALRKVGISLHSYEANRTGRTLDEYLDPVLRFVECAADAGKLCELRLWNGDSDARTGRNSLNREILGRIQARFQADVGGLSDAPRGLKLRERVYLGYAQIFDWPALALPQERENGFCYGLRDQIGVLADGTVVPCCLDSDGSIPLGNLFRQPLGEILNGQRARAVYEGFSARRLAEPLCRTCGYARRFG